MATFGGDEVSALILDIGSCWTRAGYAGEDAPKVIFPTSYGYISEPEIGSVTADGDTIMDEAAMKIAAGEEAIKTNKKNRTKKGRYIVGDSEIATWRQNMEIKNPFVDGLIQDWDALEEIWDYALEKRLNVDPSEHPLFITESAWNTREIRETLTELAFEKYDTLAFYIAKNPVLTSFATGRSTAIVLDCGASTTSCVSVVDGYVIKKGIYKQSIAGDFISEQIMQLFQQKLNINIIPHYLIAKKQGVVEPDMSAVIELRNRPNTTESYHKFMQMKVIQEFKESVCQVFETTYDDSIIAARPLKGFEFPDGFNTSFGTPRFSIPEILFSPTNNTYQLQGGTGIDTTSLMSIQQMIHNSVASCDIDIRPALLLNIILTGGTTLLPGFADRLNYELTMMMTPGLKVKIHAPGNTIERKCSSWLGGSILASLGTFHQLWISREEYDERGKFIVEKKCE